GGDARPFLDQPQEDVLGADVLVVEPLSLLVRQLHHLTSSVGKTFIHCRKVLRQPWTLGLACAVNKLRASRFYVRVGDRPVVGGGRRVRNVSEKSSRTVPACLLAVPCSLRNQDKLIGANVP